MSHGKHWKGNGGGTNQTGGSKPHRPIVQLTNKEALKRQVLSTIDEIIQKYPNRHVGALTQMVINKLTEQNAYEHQIFHRNRLKRMILDALSRKPGTSFKDAVTQGPQQPSKSRPVSFKDAVTQGPQQPQGHGTFEWKGITHHRPGPRRPSTKFEKRGTFQGAGGNGGATVTRSKRVMTQNSVQPGPGQREHRPVVKSKSFKDVVEKDPTQNQPSLSAIDAIDVRGDKDLQKPAREPMRATHAPTPSWYSVCARVLSDRKDFTGTDALIEFIEILFDYRTSDDRFKQSITNECYFHLFHKKTQNTTPLPQELITLSNEFEKNSDKKQFQKVWSVLNDPSQQFDMDEDAIVMEAFCIIYQAQIVFVDADESKHLWSISNIYENPLVHFRISIRFCYKGEKPCAYEYTEGAWFLQNKPAPREKSQAHPAMHPAPEPLRQPAPEPLRQPAQEQRRNLSDGSQEFLGTQKTHYQDLLNNDLSEVETQHSETGKCRAVYMAFKKAFGMMLHETRQNCCDHWMQVHVATPITKEQWVLIFKEVSALWNTVVLAFRELVRDMELFKYGIEIQDTTTYTDGRAIPSHHLSNLRIWYTPFSRSIDVALGRWHFYITKEFRQNTVHFLSEYQKLLMKRYPPTTNDVFGFWFYFSDLCRWIKEAEERANLPEGDADNANRPHTREKQFRWPKCCQKGSSLDDPIDTAAYKTFCRLNKLSYDDPRSRLQFCMRIRAAWLRLVACYPFAKGVEPPTKRDIQEYLQKEGVKEISLSGKKGGTNWDVVEHYSEVLLQPQNHVKDCRTGEWSDHRVLVYGAPMRAANPYLVSPR